MTTIIGLQIQNKNEDSKELQKVLTKFNCLIRTRIGLNNSSIFCSNKGIVLLQIDNDEASLLLENNLLEISGIEIQKMVF